MVRKCKLECKENNVVTVTNNNVKYYERLARQYSDASKNSAIKSEQYSKEALALAKSHIKNDENPHDVTAEQVGAFSKIEMQEILTSELAKKNPNLVSGDNISIVNNEDGTQTIGFSDIVSIDYEILENKPSINMVSLVGNKTASDLGIALIEEVPTKVSELQNDSGYLTQHQDISNLALKSEIPNISGKADRTEIPTKVSDLQNDSGYLSSIPSEYITETELSEKGYITQHQDISGLATKNELAEGLGQKQNGLSSAQLSAVNSGITSTLVSKIKDVNNGTLTIQKDGETIGTFSANSLENKIINIPSSNLGNVANTDLSNLSDTGKKVLDGQWESEVVKISEAKAIGTYSIDLGPSGFNYLPNDNYIYEVFLAGSASCIATDEKIACAYVSTSVLPNEPSLNARFLMAQTYSNRITNWVNIPVGVDRIITFTINTRAFSSLVLYVFGRRRLGTNN